MLFLAHDCSPPNSEHAFINKPKTYQDLKREGTQGKAAGDDHTHMHPGHPPPHTDTHTLQRNCDRVQVGLGVSRHN